MNLIRRLFVENLGLKVLSLFLGVLLWLQVGGQITVQRVVSIPLEFHNMPRDLEIMGDSDQEVSLIVRTDRPGTNLTEDGFAAVIDMTSARPGEQLIPISGRNIEQQPYGVEIVNLLTSKIRVRLEKTGEKTLPVHPQVSNQPEPGFRVVAVHAVPSQVTITGPESRLRSLASISTEPVNVQGLKATTTLDVYL
jgi:YbbR domain-containing protein